LVQIKSHAQKVLKRLESGEDVFGRLEENVSRLHTLVGQIHQANGLAPPIVILQPPSQPQLPQPPPPPPRQSQQPLPKLETDAVAPTAASATAVARPASPAQAEVVAPIEITGTAADHGATNGSTSATPTGTATTHHPHKQRRLIKKKADGTAQHILAASALCQLAGPDSEGNASSGNNSISEGGESSGGGDAAAAARTDEDDPAVAMVAPDSKAGIVHEEGVDTETIMVAATGDEVVDALLEL
jgi:hypothetical protein